MKPNILSELEAAIVKTVAWFSLFDYPVTAFEIWKWLGLKASLLEVEMALQNSLWLRGRLEFQDGFFVLGGRSAEAIISIRQERFLDAARKFKKLYRAAKYFSWFPFVRAVFACNNLAWRNTAAGSDIDLFIVVSPGTIWLSRLLLVTPFRLLGRRPRQTVNDPFCFSFFATEDILSLKKICLSESDPYMAYWLASLVPIFDRGKIQTRLFGQNEWLNEAFPNTRLDGTTVIMVKPSVFSFLKIFEALAKKIQAKLLPKEIKASANSDSRIIVSDSMLKFHQNDRRKFYREEWKKILAGYL